jgi:hypothetical protein
MQQAIAAVAGLQQRIVDALHMPLLAGGASRQASHTTTSGQQGDEGTSSSSSGSHQQQQQQQPGTLSLTRLMGSARSLLQLGQQLGLAEGLAEVAGQATAVAGGALSALSGSMAALVGSGTSLALDTGAAVVKVRCGRIGLAHTYARCAFDVG